MKILKDWELVVELKLRFYMYLNLCFQNPSRIPMSPLWDKSTDSHNTMLLLLYHNIRKHVLHQWGQRVLHWWNTINLLSQFVSQLFLYRCALRQTNLYTSRDPNFQTFLQLCRSHFYKMLTLVALIPHRFCHKMGFWGNILSFDIWGGPREAGPGPIFVVLPQAGKDLSLQGRFFP